MSTNKKIARKYDRDKSRGKDEEQKRFSKSRSRKRVRSDQPEKVEAPISEYTHQNAGKWYYSDPELMEQATRLSFQTILGHESEYGFRGIIPTAMVIHMNPSPGYTKYTGNGYSPTLQVSVKQYDAKASGVNLAAFKLFTQLSMRSGRTASYAPQDIITLILQLGELISMIEWARRLFGIAFTYNDRNRVWPKSVIDMLHIDSSDFMSNLANYRMRLNTIITRVKQIPIPLNIDYFSKCEMLYQNGYTDSTSPMAQVYMFAPSSTWILDETYAQGTALKTVYMPDGSGLSHATFQNFMDNVLEPMVDALLSSSTLNVIYADILNLASTSKMGFWNFDYISEAYSIVPIYNIPMLEIIHNLDGMTNPTGYTYTFDITNTTSEFHTPANDVYPDVDNNSIIYYPDFDIQQLLGNTPTAPAVIGSNCHINETIIDLMDPGADVDTRVDIMQYKPAIHVKTDSNNLYEVDDIVLPDHYVTYILEYGGVSTVPTDFRGRNFGLEANGVPFGPFTNTLQVTGNGGWNMFDWAPIRAAFGKNTSVTPNEFDRTRIIDADLNYSTSVDFKYMQRLVRMAHMGLFELKI